MGPKKQALGIILDYEPRHGWRERARVQLLSLPRALASDDAGAFGRNSGITAKG